jgi:hypothetical protein
MARITRVFASNEVGRRMRRSTRKRITPAWTGSTGGAGAAVGERARTAMATWEAATA